MTEISFPVRNRTSMKRGNVRLECLLEETQREMESFLVYNPTRRQCAYIEIAHYGRGTYVGRGFYTSNQGTSRCATVLSNPTQL